MTFSIYAVAIETFVPMLRSLSKPDAKLLARVRRFVELNRDALLEYWRSNTMTTDELQRRRRPID